MIINDAVRKAPLPETTYTEINSSFAEVLVLNEALAAVLYGHEHAGLPVYLDLEPELLPALGKILGIAAEEVEEHILRTVRAAVKLSPNLNFQRFLRAHEKWLKGPPTSTPPQLAFLCVASMAAEAMTRSEKHTAAAYYPRLAHLLGVSKDSDKVGQEYRAVCEPLWSGLSLWIEAWEGERGLPTVTTTAHNQFVGMALSQALVRSADRAVLPRMFATYGLEPQQTIAPEDMVGFLNDWLPKGGTGHLKNLWKADDVRLSIGQAASSALRTWTGAVAVGADGARDVDSDKVIVRLVATVKRHFGRKLEVNLELLHPLYQESRSLKVQLAHDTVGEVIFFPSGHRSLRLAEASVFSAADLIAGRVELSDPEAGVRGIRLPRSVVPLRMDESSMIFVESDRVVLGVRHLLLVRSEVAGEAGSYNVVEQVREALRLAARPGWTEDSGMQGLPLGWVLFDNVEFVGTPDVRNKNTALRVLTPLSLTSITFAGGLQIPGAMRRWVTTSPPEITVICDRDEVPQISLESKLGSDIFNLSGSNPVTIVSCEGRGLPDGEYIVRVKIGEEIRTASFGLRSADSVNPRPTTRLSYPLAAIGILGLSAVEDLPPDIPQVKGGTVTGSDDSTVRYVDEVPPPFDPYWLNAVKNRPEKPAGIEPLRVPPPDPSSCSVTGAHLITDLPVWTGRVTSKFMKGTCSTCGIVKDYPARPIYVWSKTAPAATPKASAHRTIDLSRIPAFASAVEEQWDPLFDAMSFLGSGTGSDLERLSSQIEGTLLASDRLARGLEVLGHLDIELGAGSLRPERWTMAPSQLVIRPDMNATLIGRRSRSLLEALHKVAVAHDLKLEYMPNLQMTSSIIISGEGFEDWETFAAEVSNEPGSAQLAVINSAAAVLAGQLPRLSSVETALPRRPLPPHRSVEIWDGELTQWVPADDSSQLGAFRFSGYGVIYGLRTEQDLAEKTITLCTVQCLKHVVARQSGRSLLAYRPKEQLLITRLGADLPGIYGRVAAMCSGRLPIADTTQRSLIYHEVPPSIASRLSQALST
jgi:hypothetical protein